jgi:hypothetical protein
MPLRTSALLATGLLLITLIRAQPARATGPQLLGASVQGRPIHVYKLGSGPRHRLLVGGIHGGYEFNTVRLMSQTIAFLGANPAEIPADVTLHIIPNLNPDGAAIGMNLLRGRFNANRVDLNRNWDYAWQPAGYHGQTPVSAGARPFSEPETRFVRAYIADSGIEAAIFYHSMGGIVFHGEVTTRTHTVALARHIADATGYRRMAGVPYQLTTGNAIDYLSAATDVSAIEIELTNRGDTDWRRSLAGIRAFLRWQVPAPTPRDDAGPA